MKKQPEIKTNDDFVKKFNELLPTYTMRNEYTRAKYKIDVTCDKGHEYF